MWIEWAHVTKIYQSDMEYKEDHMENWARNIGLLDFSASLQSGVTVILGPKGSGKSTLLKLTATLMLPDDGRITFHTATGSYNWSTGSMMSSKATAEFGWLKKRIAFLPMLNQLHQDTTVELSLLHMAQIYCLTDPRKKSCEIMMRWGLTAYRQTPLHKLRGGILKRFVLAQSLLIRPIIWILDEPTKGLDPLGKKLLWEELKNRSHERITLIATHDMKLAECADNLMLLEAGSCRRLGKRSLLTAGVAEGTVAAWYQTMQVFSEMKNSFKM
ncbi:ATP-binding cassette domain-containing protein [Thermoflavimicrobium daqui]|nr:ATP-binding cassette domain-containing protein [Thermoflavimicrobium daqui]